MGRYVSGKRKCVRRNESALLPTRKGKLCLRPGTPIFFAKNPYIESLEKFLDPSIKSYENE